MLRILLTGAALFLLGIVTWTTAQASGQQARAATEVRPTGLVQLALNPQPEPPNIPQKPGDPGTGQKGKAKMMKSPTKKGDPGK